MTKSFIVFLLLVSISAAAQRARGARQGGGQGASRGMGQSGMDARDQMRTRSPQQLHVQATSDQRQQIRSCARTAERLQKRVRLMARLNPSHVITSAEAQDWQEQLHADLEAANTAQQELESSLSSEQVQEVKKETDKIALTQEDIDTFETALDLELAMETPNPEKVKQTAAKLQSAVTQLRKEQQNLATKLGAD